MDRWRAGTGAAGIGGVASHSSVVVVAGTADHRIVLKTAGKALPVLLLQLLLLQTMPAFERLLMWLPFLVLYIALLLMLLLGPSLL